MNKQLTYALVTLTIAGAGMFAVNSVSAQVNDIARYESLSQRIAEKFGLNKDEVQTVFEEDRSQHQEQMRTSFEERLSQDVSEGKITQEQKDLILAKHNELVKKHQNRFEEMKDLNWEERRVVMEKEREELQNWSSQNGIDTNYFMSGFGKGLGRGVQKGMGLHRSGF